MDIERFDRIASTFAGTSSRRDALRGLAAAVLGAGGLMVLGSDDSVAKKKGKGKKGGKGGRGGSGGSTATGTTGGSPSTGSSGSTSGGSTSGGTTGGGTSGGGTTGGSRADRCGGPVGICNADPTPCGTTATGDVCGCERAVEGNNVCVNSGADNVCASAVECTSTDGAEATSCRNQVGFHFYCQEAKRSGNQFCGCGFGTSTGRVCVPECDNAHPL
jgi:hypothetical protein